MNALILVDLQYDFMPGGPLGVPRGDEVIPIANRLVAADPRVGRGFELVVATQDWHPPNHGSFATQHPGRKPGEIIDLAGQRQVLWPVHCVQDTPGAALVAELDTRRIARIIHKGTDPTIDSYSAFFDNGHRQATGLGDFLRQQGVTDVYLLGLATDYCVRYSALDALHLGFRTFVIEGGCRGVNLEPGDSAAALADLSAAGVVITTSTDLPQAYSLGRPAATILPCHQPSPNTNCPAACASSVRSCPAYAPPPSRFSHAPAPGTKRPPSTA